MTMSNNNRIEEILASMTLAEKIGQMTQVEKNSLTPEDVTQYFIGSVLSGGGGYPPDNSPAGWAKMVGEFQGAALQTRLGIPLLYGVDAVHGHNNVRGAVIFPHNIGLGAAHDPDLVYRIGRATAEEMAATGVYWNFAPTVAVPQDLRWGRTYEGYAQDSQLVSQLASAYIRGLQGDRLDDPFSVLATPKHYVGDGGAAWDSSMMVFPALPDIGVDHPTRFLIDQGDTRLNEESLRKIHLPPYIAAIRAGVQVVMASFSSWNGDKLHAHHYLLTDVLKRELGFTGFIVTDWAGIDQLSDDYYQAVVSAINAGIDMSMVPMQYKRFITTLTLAVENGDIPMQRIDDAVLRVLRVKSSLGLFERPLPDPEHLSLVGSQKHRSLAREAVARSLVLLKNDADTLPLAKDIPMLLVAGQWADDIGLQCGGWTIDWLGSSGTITPGTTILEAIRACVSPSTQVLYDPQGDFTDSPALQAEIGLVVLGEMPYAEGFGDTADLTLSPGHIALLDRVRQRCNKLVVLLISGRPLILTPQLPLMDTLVAAWLPGSEGQGVADVLFGDVPFQGELPYTWPKDMSQLPLENALGDPLFPFGYGLTASKR